MQTSVVESMISESICQHSTNLAFMNNYTVGHNRAVGRVLASRVDSATLVAHFMYIWKIILKINVLILRTVLSYKMPMYEYLSTVSLKELFRANIIFILKYALDNMQKMYDVTATVWL